MRDCVGLRRRCAGIGSIALFPLLTGVGSAAAGQDAAGIVGQVTDESGAVLPGVTVTAKSPSLQVPEMSTVTDDRGEYRLTPLPIGTFEVMYELSGFQLMRREELRLTSGFIAKVDIVLKVGSLEESVLAATTRSGATYVKPTSILPARLAEVSASYKF